MSQALFPGWRPDAVNQERLAPVVAALHDARPAHAPPLTRRRPDQWHATLCFVGHGVQHLATPALLQAFADAAARIPPHSFTIERMVYWPGSGAVVALPHACPPLQELCDATHDALRRCGIKPMQVTRQPHITLAYLGKHHPPQPWLDGVDCTCNPLVVERFELLFNPGGRYEALGEWPLTGPALPPPPQQVTLF